MRLIFSRPWFANRYDLPCWWYLSPSFCRIVILHISKPKSSAASPPFSVFTATREDISLLLHTFYKLDSRFTPQPCPILPNTPWFIIPMIYDLSECRECCRQTRYSFIHVPSADKVKVNVDALDDFIQNLLMCLLCTINLKPLGVSKQSVATAALL